MTPDPAFRILIACSFESTSVLHSPPEMSPVPLLLAVVLLLTNAWAQQPAYYSQGEAYCTRGYTLINDRCWPSRPNPYGPYNTRRPEVNRPRDPYEPHNLIEPSADDCPLGYKKSRGQCSKLTEREIELDRLPKEPCPEGQRKSRLVCRDFNY